MGIEAISLDEIKFTNTNIGTTDLVSRSTVQINDVDALFACQLSKHISQLKVDLQTPDLNISHNDKNLLSHTKTTIHGNITLDIPQRSILIDKFVFGINRFYMGCAGTINHDNLTNHTWVNLHLGAKINSIKELLSMIPESVVKKSGKLQARGQVWATGSLKGQYGNNVFPTLTFNTDIKDGQFQYDSLPYRIDHLEAKIETHVDLNKKHRSFINIQTLAFDGANSTLSLKGKINKLLTDPVSDLQLITDIDFGKIAQALPFNDSIQLQGRLISDLKGQFKLSDVTQNNYGKLYLKGKLQATDVSIQSKKDSLHLFLNSAKASFGANQRNNNIIQGRNLLEASYEIDSLYYTQKDNFTTIIQHHAKLSTSPLKDTLAIATIQAEIATKRCHIGIQDTVKIEVKNALIKTYIRPQKANKKLAHIQSFLKFDTFEANAAENKLFITKCGFDVDLHKKTLLEKKWDIDGKIGFRELSLKPANYKLPLLFPTSV